MVEGIASALTDPSTINDALEIFCDESGHTGPKLLDPQQRIFSYAAVALGSGPIKLLAERAIS